MKKMLEMVTTLDLPLFLQAAIDRIVAEYYQRATSSWRRYTVQDTVPNFLDVRYRLAFTDDQLDKLLEGEPYREGTLLEEERTWSVAKYGKLLKVTYEALVNDDTRQIRQMAQQYGQMIERLEPTLVANHLEALAVSNDYTATPLSAALDAAFLELAVTSFRMQTTANGRRIATEPAMIVCSPKWTKALQNLLRPTTALDFNTLAGEMEIVTERYLVDIDDAFIFADPGILPAIEVDFLSVPGDTRENYSNGPRTFWEGGDTAQALPSQVGVLGEGFRYDTLNYKVRHVVGVGSPNPLGVMKIHFTG